MGWRVAGIIRPGRATSGVLYMGESVSGIISVSHIPSYENVDSLYILVSPRFILAVFANGRYNASAEDDTPHGGLAMLGTKFFAVRLMGWRRARY